MKEFENKVVIVTGASQGIGLQIVKEFAKCKAKVIMVSSNMEKLENARKSIEENQLIESYRCDLRNHNEIKEMAHYIIEKYKTIDIVISNVGAYTDKLPWNEIDQELWDQAFHLNTLSGYYCAKYFGEFMIENHIEGNIVCIGSSSALQLKRGRMHYSVTKSALHTMVQVLALDLARHHIRINVVSPGPTATETIQSRLEDPVKVIAEQERMKKIPLGRYASMNDIANAVLFISSSKASFITGAVLPVDGGYTLGETI